MDTDFLPQRKTAQLSWNLLHEFARFTLLPSIRCWMLNVGCSMFPPSAFVTRAPKAWDLASRNHEPSKIPPLE